MQHSEFDTSMPPPEGEDLALAERLFETLRNRILDGAWAHGEKLPGTRNIAKDAGVSRWTAVVAVDMLLAEGLVETRSRSGTYVSWVGRDAGPSEEGHKDRPQPHAPFAVGVPGLDLFPMQTWRRLQAKSWRSMPVDALQTGHGAGWPELRSAIAAHVATTRGIRCSVEQIFILTSAHTALLLTAEVVGRPGSVVWVEDPGYFRARAAIQAAGMSPVGVALDEEGIDVADGIRLAPKATMAVLTSAFQFPTGVMLSDARKKRLLEWSAQVGSFIIEDDYACEFRTGKALTAPMAATPNAHRVIYMNTFSTTIFPSLRLCYLIVPKALASRFADTLRRTERYATVPNQIVLAEFLTAGHFTKHLRRCREVYFERQQALSAALRESCAGVFVEEPRNAGMHLCGRFTEPLDDEAIATAAAADGIVVEPLSRFCAGDVKQMGLLLGFAGFPAEVMKSAVKGLARIIGAASRRG